MEHADQRASFDSPGTTMGGTAHVRPWQREAAADDQHDGNDGGTAGPVLLDGSHRLAPDLRDPLPVRQADGGDLRWPVATDVHPPQPLLPPAAPQRREYGPANGARPEACPRRDAVARRLTAIQCDRGTIAIRRG